MWSHDGGELLLATVGGALLACPAPAAAELDTAASFLVDLAHREVPLPAALARGLSRRAGASRREPEQPPPQEQGGQPAAEAAAGSSEQQQEGSSGEASAGAEQQGADAPTEPSSGDSDNSSASPAELAQEQSCAELLGRSSAGGATQQQHARPVITALCRQAGQPGRFLVATSSSRGSASSSLWSLQLAAGEESCLLPLLTADAAAVLAPPACPTHPPSVKHGVSHLSTTAEGRLLLLGFRDGRVAAVELPAEPTEEQQQGDSSSCSCGVWVSAQHDLVSGGVTAVAAVPQLALLASAAEDGSLCLHQLQPGQLSLLGAAGDVAAAAAAAAAAGEGADVSSAGTENAEDLGEGALTLEQAKQRAQQEQLMSAAGGPRPGAACAARLL